MSAAKAKRTNLGRGLSALLGEDETVERAAPANAGTGSGKVLSVGQLKPSPFQPRREFADQAIDDLAASIRDKGILQPILVRVDPRNHNEYEIIAGERRWRAAQRAQLHEVPVIIKELTDKEVLEVALVENLQRQDLSPLEEAEGYARLMEEFAHTQEDLAQAVGKSRSHVANMMRLLGLPDPVKELVDRGDLSAGHARALLTAVDPVGLAHDVVKKGLNVRQTEKLAKKTDAGHGTTKSVKHGDAGKDADTIALERDLSNLLGLKVTITAHGSRGELTIAYDNLEQLDEILGKLSDKPAKPHIHAVGGN